MTTGIDHVRFAYRGAPMRSESGSFDNTASDLTPSVKIAARLSRGLGENLFPGTCDFRATHLKYRHKSRPADGRYRGIVLNAPLSSVISPVNGPVSAWGLYKGDDDQTHSDDLCRGDGWRRDDAACTCPAGLSGFTRPDLFGCAATLSGWICAQFRFGRRGAGPSVRRAAGGSCHVAG